MVITMEDETETIIDDIIELLSFSNRAFYYLDRDEKICYGLTLTQCLVLQTAFGNGRITMSQLSNKMHLTTSTMTRVVSNLVKNDYLKRKDDEKDRRIIYIALTEKGRDMALKLKECERKYRRELLNRIPKEKLPEIKSSLILLLNAIREREKLCCK